MDKSGLEIVKKEWELYKDILVPFNRVLKWDKPQYPLGLAAAITITFAWLWSWEPSVLTAIALMGIVAILLDYVVPTVMSTFVGSHAWSAEDEKNYEAVCRRIVHFKSHVVAVKEYLGPMRAERPTAFYFTGILILLILAWVGNQIDNVLLIYMIVMVVVFLPGMREQGIIDNVVSGAVVAFKRIALGVKEKHASASKKPASATAAKIQ